MAENLKLFENKKIRHQWDEVNEEFYFSIVDIISVLTDNDYQTSRKYWKNLKSRMVKEGANFELVTNCYQLKMPAYDGKMRLTDVGNVEQIFRLIQSIPSPKAEPFKMWLAVVGNERIDEMIDPEITIERALETYLKKGYNREWINQRFQAIQVRKELTDEWDDRGVKKGLEYAILTDEISKAWSGMTTREYKKLKNLKKENLRDNISTIELVLNMLAEASTTELAKAHNVQGFDENKEIAKIGGTVAADARISLEKGTGKTVITSKNSLDFGELIPNIIENFPGDDEK